MEAQNRAISVSLFELRTEILASVESGKFAFNRTKAQFLFKRSISDKIEEYDTAIRECKRYNKVVLVSNKCTENTPLPPYTRKWMNGASPFEVETVDYVDVSEKEIAFSNKAEGLRKEIIEEMREFIETSIR